MALISPAAGSGCRLETLAVDTAVAETERDRIDRSTTFEGSLYSSFPDLRTQAGVEYRGTGWSGLHGEWARG